MEALFQPKQGDRTRWEIIVDGDKWREVHRTIFGSKPTFPSNACDGDMQIVFDAYEYKKAKNYAVWRLSSFQLHSEQLAKQLQDRLVQKQTIERIIQEFIHLGFLDDETWLKHYRQSQIKKCSLPLMLSKLRAKGLSAQTVKQLAVDWNNPEEEVEAIKHLLSTRYRKKNLSLQKERQKVIASLARKGYCYDHIKIALISI